ncbi:hypothetical protein L1277_000416 [Okibacterium sp. HSC-33S16]|uniref:hypothetical protein n=1 Tax=Okibacterium sp. HSC-33S16 TaxID=2910965 RepID=UPI00209FD830|nr:hypothetical protein [Okibacterium sp. HSC-33S16]MCP2030352.1 hypothetical protein [Okibacterium sp. HSC-33S16]
MALTEMTRNKSPLSALMLCAPGGAAALISALILALNHTYNYVGVASGNFISIGLLVFGTIAIGRLFARPTRYVEKSIAATAATLVLLGVLAIPFIGGWIWLHWLALPMAVSIALAHLLRSVRPQMAQSLGVLSLCAWICTAMIFILLQLL